MLKLTIRLSLTLACLTLAGLASTSGQTIPASAGTNAPATNAPAAAPPGPPIALADVVAQAQSVTAKLQDDRTSLTPDPIAHVIDVGLPVLIRQIDERAAEDESLIEASPSLSSLQSSQDSWQPLADSLAESEKVLSDRAKQVAAQISRLDLLAKTWQATLAAAQKAAAPPEAVLRIKAVLAAIADTTKAAQADQAQIFSVQGRLAVQKGRISDGLAAMAKAMETARTQLFEQDHPPLWNAEAVSRAGAAIVAREKVSFHAQLAALKTYLKDKIPAVLIQLLLLALLAIGFYWIRNMIRSHAREEAALHHAARVFDVPLATALLLALMATHRLYPQAPPLLLAVVGAAALVPAIIIIRRLIEPALFPLLYATVIAYFVDQLRYVLTPEDVLSRFLFILELLAATIFLLTALRSRHLSASDPESNRLKRFTRIYLHLAFVVFVFAGFANVFGYVQLSILLGKGMLQSSYLAVIFYAAVRIVDALAISALSIRPLASFRMVRRHQELLYKNIATSIRWLAFALWLLAALQWFSLRDPLWHEAHLLLKTQITWFSINFELGKVLAFPITVWAAFLLSRFLRFALEEEVYPHLQLGRGIPYAASTMVHYGILLLGFFAAVAATGTQLSQFAFLAGAFGVGLGFGLQNIMNNFVSGVILLFERPIKVGDIVQIDTNMGKVERIGIRASVILLANGSELIIPNGNLISNPVTNWTLSNCERVIEIPVNVAAKVDPQHVLNLLAEVARAHSSVLKNPPPQVLLVTFGGAALTFRLRAWIDSEEEWMKITSDLSLAINAALAKENIAMS
jgi:potassium efflux system protein